MTLRYINSQYPLKDSEIHLDAPKDTIDELNKALSSWSDGYNKAILYKDKGMAEHYKDMYNKVVNGILRDPDLAKRPKEELPITYIKKWAKDKEIVIMQKSLDKVSTSLDKMLDDLLELNPPDEEECGCKTEIIVSDGEVYQSQDY